MAIEVENIKGLDPSHIYIINIKRNDIPAEYFKVVIDDFTNQLDKLGLKYAINLADHISLDIAELIPNNKIIVSFKDEKDERKE
jgi:hypothetical protein